MVAPALPAQALTVPHLQFTAVNLAPDMAYPRHLISQTDGGVTLGYNAQGATAFESLNAAGGAEQSVSAGSNPAPTGLQSNTSAVGSDGTVYTVAFYPNNDWERVAAYKAGAQQWVYTHDPACRQITSMVVGSNGNLYFIGDGCNGGQYLIGLAAGTTGPTVVADVQLPRYVNGSGALSAYSGGLAVRYTDGVGYFDYAGNRVTTAPDWHAQLSVFDHLFFTTADTGRAFVPMAADIATQQFCGNTNATSAIAAYEPTGFKWSAALPMCSQVYGIRPLYNGGAIAYIATRDNAANTILELYAVNPAGGNVPMWTMPLTGPAGATSYSNKFTTDLNGTVVLEQPFVRNETTSNGGNLDFFGVKLSLISGFTGALQGATELSGGLSDGYGFDALDADAFPAITKDVAYVPAAHCSGYKVCDYSTTSLYAVSLPGVTMDYPRGAVLTNSARWLNYVAMGDSYSSGEGVPDFMAPSDTDGCHRSPNAYAMGLNGAPGTRFSLQPYPQPAANTPTTTFVACSGATTDNVINGQNGEPPQLDALSASTDVVTLTIGGNDVGFVPYAKKCVLSDCDEQNYEDMLGKITNDLPGKLDTLFGKIKEKVSAHTRALVIGYPLIMPAGGMPTTWPDCGYMSDSEKNAVRDVITSLNQVLHDAVSNAGSPFEYVDPNYAASPFKGHELCNAGNYFNGVVGPPNEGYSFHPNAFGQDAYRKVIETYLAG